MSNVSTIYDKDVNIGLFKSINGFVKDVSIENTKIIIEVVSGDSRNHNIGMFAADNSSSTSIFKNCHVDGDIQIHDDNANTAFIGGFVGNGDSFRDFLSFENSSSNVNINAIFPFKGNILPYQIACGFFAATYYGFSSTENPCEILTIKNCNVNGTISCPGNVAGIINVNANYNDDVSFILLNNYCQVVINGQKIDVINDFVGTGKNDLIASQPEGSSAINWY